MSNSDNYDWGQNGGDYYQPPHMDLPDGTNTTTFKMPCMTCGDFIMNARGYQDSYNNGGNFIGRYHFIRPTLRNVAQSTQVYCTAVTTMVNTFSQVEYYAKRLMEQLVLAWWCIKQGDPASPSYVRAATEVMHTLANVINAVDVVLDWLTGGRVARPVFHKLPDVHNFQTWCYTRKVFAQRGSHPSTFRTLPVVLAEMRSLSNHLIEWVPYIYLNMVEIKDTHGPDCGNLTNNTQTVGTNALVCPMNYYSTLTAQLQSALGLTGYGKPLHHFLAHMHHYVSESVDVMKVQGYKFCDEEEN